MTAFPSIEPLQRSYDLGAHRQVAATFSNGDQTRFLHGTLATSVPLTLTFRALSYADARQISNHFATHGTVRAFMIPPQLWRTHTSLDDVVAAGFAWRYAGSPEETPASGGLFDVSISLLSVG